MLPTKFWFIWPSGFRGEDIFKSANQKQELPVAAMFVNGSGQNVQSLERTFYRCFLPSFSSFKMIESLNILGDFLSWTCIFEPYLNKNSWMSLKMIKKLFKMMDREKCEDYKFFLMSLNTQSLNFPHSALVVVL
jgi:hypothetical protein